MPLSCLVSPITKTNREGVGVTPDVEVCAADALRSAQEAILAKWLVREQDAARRAELDRRIAELGSAKARCTS